MMLHPILWNWRSWSKECSSGNGSSTLLQHFIVFEEDPDDGAVHKIIAGYHQFHAVNAAVEETVRASGTVPAGQIGDQAGQYWSGQMQGGKPGDHRAGVVWHTQGSLANLRDSLLPKLLSGELSLANITIIKNTLGDAPKEI